MTRNCPINEQTGDGVPVGRCDFYLSEGKTCPRHGDVQPEVAHFDHTGELTLENELRKRRGQPILS